MLKVIYYRDKKRRWRIRIKARNGRILFCTSEGDGYRSRHAAEHAFEVLCRTIAVGRFSVFVCA